MDSKSKSALEGVTPQMDILLKWIFPYISKTKADDKSYPIQNLLRITISIILTHRVFAQNDLRKLMFQRVVSAL